MDSPLRRLMALFDLGGPVVWILAALAVVALAIVLLKWWQFTAARIDQRRLVDDALTLWSQGQRAQAMARLDGSRQPLAHVVGVAMRGQHQGADNDLVREETLRIGNADLETLRHYLRPLELIAIVSPLLGLLGTVIGMIEAFQSIETAGSQVDPAVLSGGIWQALMTTAVGLSVAIPVTLAHSWLERKVDRLGHAMEDATTQVFTSALRRNGPKEPTRSALDETTDVIPEPAHRGG